MKIVWTKTAQKKLSFILDHIDKEFGTNARYSFRTRTLEFTRLLREFPEIGTLEVPARNLRAFQLSRQTRIFYRLKKNQIIVLTFFDSRQDPSKKPH